jgi:hypothetical protein
MTPEHLSWVELKRVEPWSVGRAMVIVSAVGGTILLAPRGEYYVILGLPLLAVLGLLLGALGGWLYNTMALRWGGLHLTLAITQFEAQEQAEPEEAGDSKAARQTPPLPPRPRAAAQSSALPQNWPLGWSSIACALLAGFLPLLSYALPMAYSLDRETRRLLALGMKGAPLFWLGGLVLGIVAITRGDRGRGIAGLVICAVEVVLIMVGLGWVAMQFATGKWGFG